MEQVLYTMIFTLLAAIGISLLLAATVLVGRVVPTRSHWSLRGFVGVSLGFLAIACITFLGFLTAPIVMTWMFTAAFVIASMGAVLVLGRDRRAWWLLLPLAAATTGGAAFVGLVLYAVTTGYD